MSLLKSQSRFAARIEPSLTDRITEILLNEITSGNYKLGEVLPPEQTIAERLGVSRTILREAVSRLKADGLVTSKQGRGLTVQAIARPSILRMHAADENKLDEIIAIVELRRGFEIEAASLAASRRDKHDLLAMRSALDEMSAAIANDDIAAGIEADLLFHRTIAEATRNEHYVEFFQFLSRLLRDNLTVSRTRSAKAKRGTDAQREHEIIFEAILRGEPQLARQSARQHVENTESRLRTNSHFSQDAVKRDS